MIRKIWFGIQNLIQPDCYETKIKKQQYKIGQKKPRLPSFTEKRTKSYVEEWHYFHARHGRNNLYCNPLK